MRFVESSTDTGDRLWQNLHGQTYKGGMTTLREQAVNEFKQKLRGEILQSQDKGYDEARAIWNAMIDGRPALIVHCSGVADVIEAVKFARENNLLVAARGGGHNIAGVSVCDDGLMIDLSAMNAVHVDPQALPPASRAEPPSLMLTTRPRRLAWRSPAVSSHDRCWRVDPW